MNWNWFFDGAVEVFALSTMLGVGLRVRPQEIVEPLKRWTLPARTVLANFVLVPLLAIGIARLFDLNSELALGLFLISLCSGAPITAKFTEMAGADLGYATSLIIFLQLGTILLVPIMLPFSPWSLGDVNVNGLEVLQTLALSMFAPIVVGMVVRRYWERFADRAAPWMGHLSSAALLVLVVLGIGTNHAELRTLVGRTPSTRPCCCLPVGGSSAGSPVNPPRPSEWCSA